MELVDRVRIKGNRYIEIAFNEKGFYRKPYVMELRKIKEKSNESEKLYLTYNVSLRVKIYKIIGICSPLWIRIIFLYIKGLIGKWDEKNDQKQTNDN